MKYFYFIILILLVGSLFVFTTLNHEMISVDLFFTNIEGVTKGFALVFSLLIGAIVSLMLQLPILLRRANKNKEKSIDESST